MTVDVDTLYMGMRNMQGLHSTVIDNHVPFITKMACEGYTVVAGLTMHPQCSGGNAGGVSKKVVRAASEAKQHVLLA
jgi:hypothetical protein